MAHCYIKLSNASFVFVRARTMPPPSPALVDYVTRITDFNAFKARVLALLTRGRRVIDSVRLLPRNKVPRHVELEVRALRTELKDALFNAVSYDKAGFYEEILRNDAMLPLVVPTDYVKNLARVHNCKKTEKSASAQQRAACRATDAYLAQIIAMRERLEGKMTVYGAMPSVPSPANEYDKIKLRPLEGDMRVVKPGYGVLPERRAVPRQPASFGYAPVPVYGSIPGEGTLTTSYIRAELAKARATRALKTGMRSDAPLRVSSLNVAHGQIVLASRAAVDAAIAATTHGFVEVRASTINRPDGLFVARAAGFAGGEVVAKYDGNVVSYAHAQRLIDRGEGTGVRTLRAGLWAVDGFNYATSVPHGRGLGSFATDNLDVCASLLHNAEVRCESTTLNTELLVLTDADNAAASDALFDPARAHLVLVATRSIRTNAQIFYSFMRLSDIGVTPDAAAAAAAAAKPLDVVAARRHRRLAALMPQ